LAAAQASTWSMSCPPVLPSGQASELHAFHPHLHHRCRHQRDTDAFGDQAEDGLLQLDLHVHPRREAGRGALGFDGMAQVRRHLGGRGDERAVGQIGEPESAPACQRVRGGQRGAEGLGEDPALLDARDPLDRKHDRDVDAPLHQLRGQVVGHDLAKLQRNLRVRAAEAAGHAWDHAVRRAHGEADAQRAAGPRGDRGDVGRNPFQPLEDGLRVGQHLLAGRGQSDLVRIALEQSRADLAFERRDLTAQRWLRDVQLLGGAPEVQGPGDRDEIAQRANVQHQLLIKVSSSVLDDIGRYRQGGLSSGIPAPGMRPPAHSP